LKKLKNLSKLERIDPEIARVIRQEMKREEKTLNLIASENYVSPAVLLAQGSSLTNKYAEGYPGSRYYSGCEYVDSAERLAIERALRLFGAEHANVQPHSGSQANMAVYFTMLKHEDTIMGMDLIHGGHLTHGSHVSFSGFLFNAISYGVDRDTHLINFSALKSLAQQHRPKMIIAGSSSYPRKIDFNAFRKIADEVGAYLLADVAHIAGLIVAGLHPDSVSPAHFVTTTTHKTLRGPRGGMILCKREFAKDIDKMIFPGIQGGPLMHIIAAKAVALKEAATSEFKAYQEQIVKNAHALAEELKREGLQLISGGTDTHLLLIDLRADRLTGREAEEILNRVGISVNKNSIPFDEKPPIITSGIRLGTPSLTTRGMKEDEMKEIGQMIAEALRSSREKVVLSKIKKKVAELCRNFPIYES
jgi:glycine hydroxymethyltransferase